MRKAEKIPHIHLSQVSQSGFNAKVNVLTFGKYNNLFSIFLALYNDHNIRQKKKKQKKKNKKKEFRTCYQCPSG